MTKTDNYIETYTGKKFYILDPQPEDISIIDIAHALSMMCRFNGHSKYFYSVAEHSILVSDFSSPENQLWGLLHDASEAYLADIPSPIKPLLVNYKDLEKKVMAVICDKFNLPLNQPDEVSVVDVMILRVEAHELMSSKGSLWEVNNKNTTPLFPPFIKFYTSS